MPGIDPIVIRTQFDLANLQAGANQSAAIVENATRRMKASFEEVGPATEYSVTEARHAIHGLGEELGVHLPRFVQSFVARLGGVGPLMAAAFTPIAVIGLLEVLQHVPEAIQKGIDELAGFDAEMKKVMGAAREENIKLQMEQIQTNYELAKIGAEGLGPAQKIAAEMRALGTETKATGILAGQFMRQQREMQGVATSPGFWATAATVALGPLSDKIVAVTDYFSHSNKEIEDAKEAVKSYDKAIAVLQGRLQGKPVEQAHLNIDAQREQIRLSNELVDMNRRNEESIRGLVDYYHRLDLEEKQLAADRQLFGEQAGMKSGEQELHSLRIVLDAQREFTQQMQALDEARYKRSPNMQRQMFDLEILQLQSRLAFEESIDADSYARDLKRYQQLIAQKQALDLNYEKTVQNAMDRISSDFSRSLVSVMNHQQSFARAMQGVWTNIVDTVVGALAKLAAQELAHMIIYRKLLDSEKLDQAKDAARSTWASVAKIPMIGPFLAPEAAAAAFAAVMAFEKGGIVPHDTPALLHANEMILPRHISESVQRAASTPGGMTGGHTFEYHDHRSDSRANGEAMGRNMMKLALRELRRRGLS